jgi:hypothetical protein
VGVPTPPDGRVLIALDDPTLEPSPTWTRLDSNPNLITSYTIDRGRQYELDRTDVGRATVQIADQTGLLDPSNIYGPYYGKLEPLLQVMLGRWNPMDSTWYTRYRGFIEDFNYTIDPSQNVGRLELSLVDLFEILAAIEMQDATFSDFTPARPSASLGQVFLEDNDFDTRINDVLDKAGIPVDFAVTFSGETHLWEAVYSPGESPMTAIQEAVDGDWPGVSNLYCDRRGRICAHGRLSKFDPVGVKNGDYSGGTRLDDGIWDFRQWKAGDGTAVALDASHVAHIRELAYNRGLSKIINSAYATPTRAASGVPLTHTEINAQLVTDTTSIGKYGIRSWSAQDLLTKRSLINTPDDDLSETRRFAQYYVENYAAPADRITTIGFRSMRPGNQGSAPLWDLLSRVDISDSVDVTASGANGTGGFSDVTFFVEGVHEEVRPLGVAYDDVTLHLDLSPSAYFGNPFPS